MARRTTPPPEPRPANLSAQQIQEGIPKLGRRLRELEAVKIEGWNETIQNDLDALQMKAEESLTQVFGSHTTEYKRYRINSFMHRVRMSTHGTPDHEWAEGYRRAITDAISKLKTAIEMLTEGLEDLGVSSTGQTLRAYEGLDLHSEIDRAAGGGRA